MTAKDNPCGDQSLWGPQLQRRCSSITAWREPCFGEKVEELKKIQKRIRKDYRLALDLYDTGV